MAIPVLSQSDIALLREIVTHYRQLVQAGVGNGGSEQDLQASDVYIARAPTEGIPALTIEGYTGTSEGLGGEIPVPGYAECQIWRVSELVLDSSTLSQVGYLTKLVFNVAQVAIEGDTFFPVVKDKHGIWFATHSAASGGGGCTNVIRYISKICLVDESTGTGTA